MQIKSLFTLFFSEFDIEKDTSPYAVLNLLLQSSFRFHVFEIFKIHFVFENASFLIGSHFKHTTKHMKMLIFQSTEHYIWFGVMFHEKKISQSKIQEF